MQMLCQIDTPDYASWKSAFDDDYEERMQAGLSQLQIWRDADHGSAVLVLFVVVPVVAVYLLGQVVESLYLTPRLVGEAIGLHPIAVLFALAECTRHAKP